MQIDATTTPTPSKRIVSLRLTDDQRSALGPWTDVKNETAAIFMVLSSSVDLSSGATIALMQAAILPIQEARATINHLRKVFGKPALPGAKKAKKQ